MDIWYSRYLLWGAGVGNLLFHSEFLFAIGVLLGTFMDIYIHYQIGKEAQSAGPAA